MNPLAHGNDEKLTGEKEYPRKHSFIMVSFKPEILGRIQKKYFEVIQSLIENQSLCRTKNISALNTFFFIPIKLESMPIDLARAIC